MYLFNKDIEHGFLNPNNINKLLTKDHFKILKDIKKELKHKNLSEIQRIFDVNIIKTSKHCGGYCNIKKRIIAIHENTDLNSHDFKETLSHELSHIIQGKTNDLLLAEDSILLSEQFRVEQQCDAIAIELHKILFNSKYQPAYADIDSAKFLMSWYGNFFQNDLIISNEK